MADLAAVACSNAEAFERAQIAARTDSLTGLLNHGARAHPPARGDRAREPDGRGAVVPAGRPGPLQARERRPRPPGRRPDPAPGGRRHRRRVPGLRRHRPLRRRRVRAGAARAWTPRAPPRRPTACAAASTARCATRPWSGVTASVGVARWREPLSSGELLDRADRALLVAKRMGKNQVAVAGQQTEAELARLDAAGSEPSALLADLWDVVSHCEHPREVLTRLPALLTDSLNLADCVLVHPKLLGDPDELLRRVDGGDRPPVAAGAARGAGADRPAAAARDHGRPRRGRAAARRRAARPAGHALGRVAVPAGLAAPGRADQRPGRDGPDRTGRGRLADRGRRAGRRHRRARQLHPRALRAGGGAGHRRGPAAGPVRARRGADPRRRDAARRRARWRSRTRSSTSPARWTRPSGRSCASTP